MNKYVIAYSYKSYNKLVHSYIKDRELDYIIHCVHTETDLQSLLETEASIRYIFFLHWNWKVPENILSAYECVCFHMTDVPYGRGGSPLQNLILRGHQTTWLSALRMTNEFDAGPVYTKQKLTLDGRAEDIYKRAGLIAMDIMEWIIQCEPKPYPQKGEPTYFRRRQPEESNLPSSGSLRSIHDFIRMLDAPEYPKAFLKHGDFRIEFEHADLSNDEVKATVTITKMPQEPDE